MMHVSACQHLRVGDPAGPGGHEIPSVTGRQETEAAEYQSTRKERVAGRVLFSGIESPHVDGQMIFDKGAVTIQWG